MRILNPIGTQLHIRQGAVRAGEQSHATFRLDMRNNLFSSEWCSTAQLHREGGGHHPWGCPRAVRCGTEGCGQWAQGVVGLGISASMIL